jgi:hypothetical protein
MAYGVELALGAMACLGLADLLYKRGAFAARAGAGRDGGYGRG